jgi:hypothetical protein
LVLRARLHLAVLKNEVFTTLTRLIIIKYKV